jgi:hypothetical protein
VFNLSGQGSEYGIEILDLTFREAILRRAELSVSPNVRDGCEATCPHIWNDIEPDAPWFRTCYSYESNAAGGDNLGNMLERHVDILT